MDLRCFLLKRHSRRMPNLEAIRRVTSFGDTVALAVFEQAALR
jgi:hypothetical protein